MAGQCVICEGQIVNGRCRLCGMPFRRDAELYHLNEQRADHMRHASVKAKKIMSTYPEPAKMQTVPGSSAKSEKPSGSSWHNKEVKKTGSSMAKEEQKRVKNNKKQGSTIVAVIYFVIMILYLIFKLAD